MNQNKKILISALVAVFAIGALIFVAKKPAERAPVENKIRLGFIRPLTGNFSELGIAAKAAVELATEEINREGGVSGKQVEIIYEDGKCGADAALNAAQKLVNADKVNAIIGGLCSEETLAFGKFAMDEKIITVSYCSSAPVLSALGRYFFRAYPSGGNADIIKQSSKLGIKPESLDPLQITSSAKLPDGFRTNLLAKIGGEKIPQCAAQAYDAAKLLAATFAKVGTNPDAAGDELHMGGYTGVSGQIVFDQNGDLLNPKYIVKKAE